MIRKYVTVIPKCCTKCQLIAGVDAETDNVAHEAVNPADDHEVQ